MTLLHMLEIIKQQFPDKMETQIRLDLNNAYHLYSEETRLPFKFYDVEVSNGAVSYMHTIMVQGEFPHTEVPTLVGTALVMDRGWYELPLDVGGIVTIEALDERGNELVNLDYHIEYVGRRFAIFTVNNFLYSGTGLPSGIKTLRFGCSVIPLDLSVDSDTPDYPDTFHQGLVDHVLANYYSYRGILQQSGWFRSAYQAQVQSGKRYFNRNMQ